MVEESGWKELEAAGHTETRKRVMDVLLSSSLFHLIQFRILAREWCHPRWIGLISTNVTKVLSDTIPHLSHIFHVILDSVVDN